MTDDQGCGLLNPNVGIFYKLGVFWLMISSPFTALPFLIFESEGLCTFDCQPRVGKDGLTLTDTNS